MEKKDKKIISILLIMIIIFSAILIYKINKTPKYDEELYAEVYEEYNQIIDNNINKTQSNVTKDNGDEIHITRNLQGDTYRVVATIRIPEINISYPIISESTEEYLKIAPAKLCGGNPNTIGNFCIVGHNYRNGKHFGKLSSLKTDSIVELADRNGNITKYKVYNMYKTDATDTSCTSQDTDGKKELTLITCTSNKNIRLIVKCVAVG